MTTIQATLKIGRATVYRAASPRPRHLVCPDDRAVTAQIKSIVRAREGLVQRPRGR